MVARTTQHDTWLAVLWSASYISPFNVKNPLRFGAAGKNNKGGGPDRRHKTTTDKRLNKAATL
jgi:hypothetical protein